MARGRECCVCWLQEFGEEGGVVRGWVFLLVCKSQERKSALCENGGFLLVARVGRREEGTGRKGIFMARGTHSAIIEKTGPEMIRVAMGSVQFKLIKF
jgi:hypothetical protein